MERATKKFAGWVLLMHVGMFLLLVAIVVLASREFYYNARTQAFDQLRVRQEMLAMQSARGIERFYREIVNDLELSARSDLGVPRETLAKLAWERLRGRAIRLFEVDGDKITFDAGDAPQPAADAWKQVQRLDGADAKTPKVIADVEPTLVVVPGSQPSRRSIVIVPIRAIESRFLSELSLPENVASYLIANNRIVAAEDRTLIGQDANGKLERAVASMWPADDRGERVSKEVRRVGEQKVDAAMVTLQPIDLPGGTRWWLAVSSRLTEADQAVGTFLRRSIIGAALVIVAMTAVLLSTSIQTIRSRLRLERVQHDMVTRELASARDIQLAWLPDSEKNAIKLEVDIAAMNKPASHVSGDFYNWFELPDGRAVIVVGDVTGHGLPAAFLMATTQLLVRVTIDPRGDPGEALRIVNRQLCSHHFSGQFVTMLVMVLDPKTNSIQIANAGHPPPLIGTGDAFAPLDLQPELVLAVDDTVHYTSQRFELAPGSSILLYTDGITDVQSPTGERLGIEGLAKSLFGRFGTASSLVAAATDAVESFRAGREADDDLTIVAIQLARTPEPAGAPPEPAAAAQA